MKSTRDCSLELTVDGSNAQAEAPREEASSGVIVSLFRAEQSPGFWVRNGSDLRLVLEDGGAALDIVRLGGSALWITTPAHFALPEGAVSVTLRSKEDVVDGLTARFVELAPGRPGGLVGVRLDEGASSRSQAVLAFLVNLMRAGAVEPVVLTEPVRERISEPKRLRAIMGALATVQNRGVVRGAPGQPRVTVQSLERHTNDVLWRSESATPTAWGEGPHTIDVVGYNSVYRLEIDTVCDDEAGLRTPLPRLIERVRHRNFRRAEGALRVTLREPVTGTVFVGHALDVSYGGLRVSMPAQMAALRRGTVIEDVLVEGSLTAHLRATVRSFSASDSGKEVIFGLAAEPRSSDGDSAWTRIVSEALFPGRVPWTDAQAVWELLEKSGYFSLDGHSAEEFEQLREPFEQIFEKGRTAPHLVRNIVWSSARGAEATASLLKAYSGTWLYHQLARHSGPTGTDAPDQSRVLRELYTEVVEHSQSDPAFRYAISIIETTVPWMRQAHVEFVEQAGAVNGLVVPTCVRDHAANDRVPVRAEWSVCDASAEERQWIGAWAQKNLPDTYVDALDLTPERLSMKSVANAWRAKGLTRTRRVVIVKRANKPIGAGLFELGEPGINLYGLLDSLRTYFFEGFDPDAFSALIDEAARYYAAHGRERFVHLDDAPNEPYRIRPDARSQAALWILRAPRISDFIEYIHELTRRKQFR